jgi:hypothetical protein
MQFFNTAIVVALTVRLFFFKHSLMIKNDALTWIGCGMIAFFLAEAISLLYTTQVDKGLGALERKLSFVVVPLFFFSIRQQLSELNFKPLLLRYLYYFLGLMVLLYLYGFYRFLQVYFEQQWLEENFFTIELPFLLGMSHVYFGLYAVFAISVGFWFFLTEPKLTKIDKNIILSVIGLACISMTLITAKSALVSTLIISIYFIVNFGIKRISIKSFVLVTLSGIMLLCLLMTYSKNVSYRLTNALNFKDGSYVNSLEDYKTSRVLPLQCSKQLLISMPFEGYGAGDVQSLLNNCYTVAGFDKLENLNPHNQIIQSTLGGGYPQLFVLIGLIILLLTGNGVSQTFLVRSFGILFLVSSMTESVLERNKGIVLFCFGALLLYSIFVACHSSSKKTSDEH